MRTIYNKLLETWNKYLFIQKFQRMLSLNILFYAVPLLSSIHSDIHKNFQNSLVGKFLPWYLSSYKESARLTAEETYKLMEYLVFLFGIPSYFITLIIIIYSQINIVRTISVNGYFIKRTNTDF